jgi:hypothetical protein
MKWNEIRKNYRIYSDGKSVFEIQNDIFKKINLTSNRKTQVNGPTKEAVPAIITASKTIINKNQIQNKEKTKRDHHCIRSISTSTKCSMGMGSF